MKALFRKRIAFLLFLMFLLTLNSLTVLAAESNNETAERGGYVSEISSGPLAGVSFDYMRSQNSPLIEDVGPIDGKTIYVGEACDESEPIPAATDGHDIALVERGNCLFVEKMNNIEGKGYSAVMIFNDRRTDSDGCDSFPSSMSTTTSIPLLAIARSTGLQLLGEAGADGANCPDGLATQAQVGSVGERVFISAEFDPNSTETGFEQRDGNGWTTPTEEAEFLKKIAAKSKRVNYSEVGTSIEGRPIFLVRVGYPVPPPDKEIATGRNLLIMGTPHGNEPAGQEMSLQLLRDLAFTEDPELLEKLNKATVLFVPTPNPDGRAANRRTNSLGLDNNRDHINLKSPEIQAVAKVLNRFHPDITVDAHERPSGSRPDMEMAWPRNLNVDEELRALNVEMVQEYLRPDVEAAGFSTGIYGTPTSDLNGSERVLSNMLGLRHGLGLLTESAGTAEPKDRVEMQRRTVESVLSFYHERFDDIATVVDGAAQRKKAAGAAQTDPFYLDGSDNRVPEDSEVMDPPPCGYLLNTSQAKSMSKHIKLFSLKTEKSGKYGVFVTMAQSMMTVVPLLLDERAKYTITDGLALYDCSAPGSVEPPLGLPSVVNLQILVERFQKDGEFVNDKAVRSLQTHLTAVDRYEDKELKDKVVKHMKGFKLLLENQQENELISKKAFNILKMHSDDLINKWQHVFYQDFRGEDGDPWDPTAFGSLDTWPGNPAGAKYSLKQNTGQIILDKRLQENGSAYGRVTPNMEELEDSEMFVRFRVNELGNNQRLRLWLQADAFSSGSTMPVNGYGIELNTNTNKLILRGRKDSRSTNFGSADADLSTDWHSLKLRVDDDKLMVRLWNDKKDEPDEWNMVHTISPGEKINSASGKSLLSFINFDYDNGNTFYIDEIIIDEFTD